MVQSNNALIFNKEEILAGMTEETKMNCDALEELEQKQKADELEEENQIM